MKRTPHSVRPSTHSWWLAAAACLLLLLPIFLTLLRTTPSSHWKEMWAGEALSAAIVYGFYVRLHWHRRNHRFRHTCHPMKQKEPAPEGPSSEQE